MLIGSNKVNYHEDSFLINVCYLIMHRTKKQRDVIIKCFYGQVRKLIRHKVSLDFSV